MLSTKLKILDIHVKSISFLKYSKNSKQSYVLSTLNENSTSRRVIQMLQVYIILLNLNFDFVIPTRIWLLGVIQLLTTDIIKQNFEEKNKIPSILSNYCYLFLHLKFVKFE